MQMADLNRIQDSQRHLLTLIDQVLSHAQIGMVTVPSPNNPLRDDCVDHPVTRGNTASTTRGN